MYHWGAIVVAPGYTDDAFSKAGGNPYGIAHPSGEGPPGPAVLDAARRQGQRLARISERLAAA
jgi:NAD(P)H dehydrogenase (quinone)